MIKYQKPVLDLPGVYTDEEGNEYSRLVGGIGWPQGGNPAFAIVLAEIEADPVQYQVLTSMEDYNALKLMETCRAVEISFPVSCWYGNHLNRVMMQLLYEFNKTRDAEYKLKFQGAPLAGEERNSGYYLPLILEMGQVGRKRLSAGVSPKLYNALHNITPETHLNRNIEEFPILAALSYPLAFLLTYKQVKTAKVVGNQLGKNAWQL